MIDGRDETIKELQAKINQSRGRHDASCHDLLGNIDRLEKQRAQLQAENKRQLEVIGETAIERDNFKAEIHNWEKHYDVTKSPEITREVRKSVGQIIHLCDIAEQLQAELDKVRKTLYYEVPQKFPDNCEICKGKKCGVKGNENIVNGVIVCDYCSVIADEQVNDITVNAKRDSKRLRTELEPLKQFARKVIQGECWDAVSLNGGEIQELAVKLGLIEVTEDTESDIFQFTAILKDN